MWDQIEGNWKQLKGRVQVEWGKLTDDDVDCGYGRSSRAYYGDQSALDDSFLCFRNSSPASVHPIPSIRKVLEVATISLLAYAAVLIIVHVPWGEVIKQTFQPTFIFNADSAAVIVAVFGTTISPYLFFWQASEEVEDMHMKKEAPPLLKNKRVAGKELRRIRWDTWSGMVYSNIAAYFIILATAVTLHVSGITDINTAAQAASAPGPLAGDFAFLLFAIGILGVGLIGVPVLAGSGAYALSEVLNWNTGTGTQVFGCARVLQYYCGQCFSRACYPVYPD